MIPRITVTDKEQELDNLVVVISKWSKLPGGVFNAAEKKYLKEQVEDFKKELVTVNRLTHWVFLYFLKGEAERPRQLESLRKAGDQIAGILNEHKFSRVSIFDAEGRGEEVMALAEGMALGSYQFLKFKTEEKKSNTLEIVEIYSTALEQQAVEEAGKPTRKNENQLVPPAELLNIANESVVWCRDLINEPNSHQTATTFAGEVERVALEAGARAEVLNRKKLEALKMGGILGVNRGSHEPPAFTVVEWKPANAGNIRPVVLVGKGVIFDTGGMNLKPGNSMLGMKNDMAGAAAVAATLRAVAKAKLPLYVVGLMPATDNRPGPEAMVPGDVITMHNGATVEVVDTDAEGRLLLADALCYAQKYNPLLVIDLATLTGSAVRAIGKFAAAAMHKDAGTELVMLMTAGDRVFERLAGFPMWEEYGESLKSDIADMKNLGQPEAGLITAAKFLEHFTKYPYIHLDIAGPAFADKRDSYRGTGGTGFGVRLLVEFLQHNFTYLCTL